MKEEMFESELNRQHHLYKSSIHIQELLREAFSKQWSPEQLPLGYSFVSCAHQPPSPSEP